MLTPEQLLGLDDSHLDNVANVQLERRTAKAFVALQQAAAKQGFNLQICSGWRPFERQLRIFNGKACGQRPLQNREGELLQANQLSHADLLDAILTWSALPGASRHHWGTDLDLFDANSIEQSELKLEPWEYQQGGPNYALSQWLIENMQQYGFFHPYQQDLGGVAPEPWHISYAPVAVAALSNFSAKLLEQTLINSEIELKSTILAQLPDLVERYCYRIHQP